MEAKLNPSNLTLTDPVHWRKNYYQYLYRYAASKIADITVIDDLIQEVFLIALENLSKFNGNSTERTWLTGILKNTIFVYFRRRKAFKSVFVDMEEVIEKEVSDEQPPATLLSPVYINFGDEDGDDLRKVVHKGIRKLPAIWRSVFIMKYVEEQPVSVICNELQLSHSNYWMISHRARTSVRVYVDKERKKLYA